MASICSFCSPIRNIGSCFIHHLNKGDLQKRNGKEHLNMGVVITVVYAYSKFIDIGQNIIEEDQKEKRIDRVIEYGIDLFTTLCHYAQASKLQDVANT